MVDRRPDGAKRPRPTLADVARHAGVSRSTTSRVLNDHPSVRPDVRDRVRRVMAELGYRPDETARALRRGRSGIVGLVIPRPPATIFGDAYFAALVSAMVAAGDRRDRTIAMVLADRDGLVGGRFGDRADPVDVLPERLGSGALLDGVVITASVDGNPLPATLRAVGTPVVVIGDPRDRHVTSVDVDNVTGGRVGVEHLVSTGRRHIGVVAGPVDNASARSRREGARRALATHGLRPAIDVAAGDFSAASGRDVMARLVERVDVDAVVAGSDSIAAGVLAELVSRGRRVPHDVAVVGFDDLPPSRQTTPALTTVRQPIQGVADEAMAALVRLVESPDQPSTRTVLDVELVVRASTSG